MSNLPQREDMVKVALAAGKHIRSSFRLPKASRRKGDGTLVTTADILSQRTIAQSTANFPNVGLIGEEGNLLSAGARYLIAADPLDGTGGNEQGLAHGAVAIALMERRDNGRWYPIKAVIYEPNVQDGWLWYAEKGAKTIEHRPDGRGRWKERGVTVTPTEPPFEVTVSTWATVPHNLLAVRNHLELDNRFNLQVFGSIVPAAGMIASGWRHAMLFGSPSGIEAATMSLIGTQADCEVTDLYGAPLDGFELGILKGKTDLLLPKGIMITNNPALTLELSAVVRSKNS